MGRALIVYREKGDEFLAIISRNIFSSEVQLQCVVGRRLLFDQKKFTH
jgi:hypothetical protein